MMGDLDWPSSGGRPGGDGDAAWFNCEYGTQIFGIELGRERRRADKVSEHHGKLASLRVALPSWFGRHGCQGCRSGSRGGAEIADRPQHFQPVSE